MTKIEYKNPLDVTVSKIFGIFHILSESNRFNSSQEPIQLVLLILSMYKDGFISINSFNDPDSFNKFEETLDLIDKESYRHVYYSEIVSYLSIALSRIGRQTYNRISNVLIELDYEYLRENFTEVFDDVLYRTANADGRYAGEFFQPAELTRLICAIADLPGKAKVFNPFAGLASFGVYLESGQNYYGQEDNLQTWTLGYMRLMAYERQIASKYVCVDSVYHWPGDTEKFDLVVSNPPYDLRFPDSFSKKHPEIRTIEHFIIQKGLNSLNEKGKLIALLPQRLLFDGRYKQLRKQLIEHNLLKTVIYLPGGILLNSSIPLIIIVVDKNNNTKDKVQFIDATKFVESKSSRDKVLNYKELIKTIQDVNHNSDFIRIIDKSKIKANGFNLSVLRYFQKNIELENREKLVKLKDILEYVKGHKDNLPDGGKLVRIRDLRDDNVDFQLNDSNIENSEFKRRDIRQISETCLILASIGRNLKPTYFYFKGTPIYLNKDILSFKVNETIADYRYIINELQTDYVQKQLESYRLGTTIPYWRKDDLLEVGIKLLPLEEQRAKVQGIYELSDKIRSLQAERNALAHGKSLNQFSEFASLKHTLGRPRQNILDWSDNLLHFLNAKREGFEALNKAFTEFYDTDIISALKEIKRDVNFITDVLERGENGFVLDEYEKTTIPLSDINSLINELSNNGLNFKIKKMPLKSEKIKDRGISANRTLFKTLLDNILTNANKYAFNKKEVGNVVIIELTEVGDLLFLEIKNNGKPFPKNFNREKFVTKYSTADSVSGSGLGGYDIHRIATYFNNPDWELALNDDPFYMVKFKFQFPIKLLN